MTAVLLIVRKSLRQHLFSSLVNLLTVALASGLVMAVFALQAQARAAFIGGNLGWDAVLGARGSQLQLVLNTVFQLETSPGNIPWTLYTQLRDETPGVRLAVPYATGDNYLGYRIVGTTEELWTKFRFRNGGQFEVQPGGRFFDPKLREAVVGSYAALKTGLEVGDVLQPYHGVHFSGMDQHAEQYVVTGILEPTNTPSDRAIYIPIEGIFRMEGHVLRGTGEIYAPEAGREIPDEHKEISAVMLQLASPSFGWQLDQTVNRQGRVATLAFPIGAVMMSLFERLAWAHLVLRLVACLVILVSACAILAAIYNTINERRREFAILRAVGAHRRTIFAAIICEAAAIGFLGALAGFVVYGAILAGAATLLRAQAGIVLDPFALHAAHIFTPLIMALLGALAGFIPAVRAYRTDVAQNLLPQT